MVISLDVIEELDTLKQRSGNGVGVAAREAIRTLEELRLLGDLGAPQGVTVNSEGGTVRVATARDFGTLEPDLLGFGAPALDLSKTDNRLLLLTKWLSLDSNGVPVILVTKDLNLRVKADVLGLRVEDYLSDKVSITDLYTGTRAVQVERAVVDTLYKEKILDFEGDAQPNELLYLESLEDSKHAALGIVKYPADGESEVRLIPDRSRLLGSKGARNREQQMALELLLDPDIPLVTINGSLGTGKTFITLLGALHAVLDLKLYDQILIARKYVHHSVKEGFLPGDLSEKSEPWMKPFYACLDALLSTKQAGAKQEPIKPHEYLVERGYVQCEHLAYIRGVTYNNKFIIIDEAANLTPAEAKTIIGRAGEGTKVVLLGDIEQIDDPYLEADSNGLAYTISTWKSDPLAGHITLVKGERSALAERASRIM